MKTILILTASFGEGHNAAARNLRESLSALAPDTRVVVSDVFLESYGWLNRLGARAYLQIINHLPGLWQKTFDLIDRTSVVGQHIGIYRAAGRRLLDLLDTLRPETVVSVYPGCNHLLDHVMRLRVRRPFRTVTIITDSLTINSVWLRVHSDLFLVANAATAAVVREAGVPAAKILAPGFPVPRIFASLPSPSTPPAAGGRWKVLYVINSGRHLAPEIVRHLLTVEGVEFDITVGRDESLRRDLDALCKNRPVTLHGWTPELPRLMANAHLLISKAGGATVQEALAAGTPMIITQVVPGQEEGNARLVIEQGAGVLATRPETIAGTVRAGCADGGKLWQSWRAAAGSLGRPDASDAIARIVLEP